MSEPEIYTTWVVSTAHLTRGDSLILTGVSRGVQPGERSPFITEQIGVAGEFGWRVYVQEDDFNELVAVWYSCHLSKDFLKIMTRGHQMGVRWVSFDRDGQTADEFETHDW